MKHAVQTNKPVEEWSEIQLIDYITDNNIRTLVEVRAKQLQVNQMINIIKEYEGR